MYLDHYATDLEKFTVHDGYNGRPAHPAATGPTRSPCKRRPETGAPCPLAAWDKGNNVCVVCLLRFGLEPDIDPWQIHDMIKAGQVHTVVVEDTHIRARHPYPCDFPGCNISTAVPGYCGKHRDITTKRRVAWQKHREGEPPIEFLHQPFLGTGQKLFPATKYHGGVCKVCGGTERYAANRTCVACSDERNRRRRELRRVRRTQ